ncbi:hypothetical protein D5R81_05050 [Parashewanella spongiae]|uniref:Uncharacterized protein n=1 Tax=Parashewanella spongiae TaxID=342950 RepID=A0A3A6U386_9GAMM|nr:hypothetical protein D5R81_05050 [Parashewanella spongiae]
MLLTSYKGESFVTETEGGRRLYYLNNDDDGGVKQIPDIRNLYIKVIGLFLLCSGVFGFVLEQKLFK